MDNTLKTLREVILNEVKRVIQNSYKKEVFQWVNVFHRPIDDPHVNRIAVSYSDIELDVLAKHIVDTFFIDGVTGLMLDPITRRFCVSTDGRNLFIYGDLTEFITKECPDTADKLISAVTGVVVKAVKLRDNRLIKTILQWRKCVDIATKSNTGLESASTYLNMLSTIGAGYDSGIYSIVPISTDGDLQQTPVTLDTFRANRLLQELSSRKVCEKALVASYPVISSDSYRAVDLV